MIPGINMRLGGDFTPMWAVTSARFVNLLSSWKAALPRYALSSLATVSSPNNSTRPAVFALKNSRRESVIAQLLCICTNSSAPAKYRSYWFTYEYNKPPMFL